MGGGDTPVTSKKTKWIYYLKNKKKKKKWLEVLKK